MAILNSTTATSGVLFMDREARFTPHHGGVILVLISGVFLFGAVQPAVLAITEALIIILFLTWWIPSKEKMLRSPLFYPLVIFLILGLLQIIPLPLPIVKLLSPSTVALKRELGVISWWTTLSLVPGLTLKEWVRWLTILLLYILVVNLFQDRKNLTRLLNSLLALSIFEALYGLFLFATGSPTLLWYKKPDYATHRVHGTYRNPDHFAGYMEMAAPLHLSQVLTWRHESIYATEERSKRLLGLFLVVILSLSLFFSISRAGIVAFISSMAFWFLLKSKEETATGSRIGRYLWLFIILLAAYLLWVGLGPILERFVKTTETIEKGRMLVWKDTLTMIKDFPLFGTGLGTYQYAFPHYKTFPMQVVFDHAHNDYLELLAEGGISLVLPFLWGLWRILRWSLTSSSLITLGAATGMVALLIHSFFDFNFHIPANAYLFFTLAGISWIARMWRE